MNKEIIGLNAGSVWCAISTGEWVSLKAIKKITKLKDKELYFAFGWLAREEKIEFNEENEELLVRLV